MAQCRRVSPSVRDKSSIDLLVKRSPDCSHKWHSTLRAAAGFSRKAVLSIAESLMLLAFNKPYGVLSRFTTDGSANRTLAEFGFPKNVYPIGRLDADSEGLLLLSDEAGLNQRLLHPRNAHEREYWVQGEKIPAAEPLRRLQQGVVIQEHTSMPCRGGLHAAPPEGAPREP